MTTIRRTAVLLGLTAAVLIGGSIPASAAYSAQSTAVAARAATVTVAPPTGVTHTGTWCERTSTSTTNATTGVVTTTHVLTLHAKLAWQASGTRGVTGYRLAATVNGQAMPVGDVPTTGMTRSFEVYRGSTPAPAGYLTLKASVQTLTSYGWTSTVSESGWFSC
jgi:hypothetical protein